MIDQSLAIPTQVIEGLRSALGERLVSVILFGSQARGEATSVSDWDLFIIARELPVSVFERHLLLKRLLPEHCRSLVSILARTPEEFQAHLPSLYLDIAIDGKILYDSDGYAEKRFSYIRRLVQKAGLYREHTPAGDLWLWEKPPVGAWTLEWEH